MPERLCPHCQRPGRFLEAPSRIAMVEYYRCNDCGHVWTYDKNDPDAPPMDVTRTDEAIEGVQSLAMAEPEPEHTGLVCPNCTRPIAIFDYEPRNQPTHDVWFKCPGCGHSWGVTGTPPTGMKVFSTK